ncbi:sensor histidine kinase [Myxacorys almedinensis]|uniref:histidine kinase n=1 Tax=Myxacorys almedinensis A TaxID=2690445 RepID=A0A8J7Z2Y9_9CYAN|nr:HAMP domain-containing sensor histidine kinase [Myxacorys almedinensis]NDJ16871.1 hypothetical protein [Myxacorys almedinensis A]
MIISSILVIAQEPWVKLDLKHRLIRLGYDVAIASCLSALRERVWQVQPELVMLDARIAASVQPGLVEAIGAEMNLPIVIFGVQGLRLADPVLERWNRVYLANPWETEALRAAIATALSHHQTQTHAKQTQTTLQETLHQEIAHRRRQTQFMRSVDHELRTPLSTLLVTFDWIEELEQEDYSSRSLQKLTCLDRARSSVRRMGQLLDYSSLLCQSRSGDISFRPVALNLLVFCRVLIDELRELDHEITIRFSANDVFETQTLVLDPTLLRHILSNLLSNAIKYSSKGEIRFELQYDSGAIAFRIQDQGIGIPQSELAELFTPFYRGSNVGTIGGTGLGLAIADQLVRAYQGTIIVNSEVNVGSTFTVTIPCKFQK